MVDIFVAIGKVIGALRDTKTEHGYQQHSGRFHRVDWKSGSLLQMSYVVKPLHGSRLNNRFIIDGAPSQPY